MLLLRDTEGGICDVRYPGVYSSRMSARCYPIELYTPCIRVAGCQPATRIPPQPSHTETPTHIETRTHEQCGDSIKKSQAPVMDVLMSETC